MKNGFTALAAAFTFGLVTAGPAVAADSCANAAFRTGVGANLPDCRAYEQVSPVDKNGNEPNPRAPGVSNPAGDRMWFASGGAITDEPGGVTQDTGFLASRSADWTTVNTDGPVSPGFLQIRGTLGLSEDGTKSFLVSLRALTSGAVEGNSNLYVKDLTRPDAYTLVTSVPGRGFYDDAMSFQGGGRFVDASADMSSVVFATNQQVLAGGPSDPDGNVRYLYLWHEGQVTLASVLPDGTPNPVLLDSRTIPRNERLLAADGRTVTFSGVGGIGGSASLVYRYTPGQPTRLVSRSDRAGIEPRGAPVRAHSTEDGSQVFFVDGAPLTNASNVGTGAIYRWTADGAPLNDLTSGFTTPGANEDFTIINVSPDGGVVYFLSRSALTPGAGAGFAFKVYALDVATEQPRLVTRIELDGQPSESFGQFRMSPDGRRIAFSTYGGAGGRAASNNPACTDGGPNRQGVCAQIYSWDFDAPQQPAVCVSCVDGVVPDASADFGLTLDQTPFTGAENRAITDDGRVFFNTATALTASDANTANDVYQFSPGNGQALLSAGRGGARAVFADASEDGSTVFITTAQPLVPQDTDTLADVYALRVGGGIASQQVAPPARDDGCSGEACRPENTVTPPRPVPGTSAFTPLSVVQPRFSFSRPSARTLRSAGRSGRLTVPVRVTLPGRVTATLTGRLSGRKSSRAGSAAVSTTKAGTVRLTVRLSKRARAVLKRRGTLKLRLTVRYSRQDRVASTVLTFTTGRAATSNQGGAR